MTPPPQARAYRDGDRHSWAVGRYAVLELLRRRPDLAERVVWHAAGPADARRPVLETARLAGVEAARDDAQVARARRKGDAHVAARFDARTLERELDDARDHLLLVAPDHFGNVGTTIRSMLAFGLIDLALVTPSLPPAHPHVVRASVGAVFGVRVRRFASVENYRARHRRTLHAFRGDGETPLGELRWARPATLAFGPERTPRPEERLPRDASVRIVHDRAVESLNLAVAAGIALHAWRAATRVADPTDPRRS